MKKNIDISIILIVRNNWEQIEKCLKSILQQPGIKKEIILLNDESDDGAGANIKKFADAHECIHLFEQKYKGLANSRNKAIKQITGLYTLFIDQEQVLQPFSLQIALKDAIRYKADILQMPFIVESENNSGKKTSVRKMPKLEDSMTGAQYVKAFAGKNGICTENYANLINSEYLKEHLLKFDYRIFEDCNFEFYAKAIVGASSIATTQTPICVVHENEISDIAENDESIKAFRTEQEYIRKNFNEYADSNYFSSEPTELLRYMRHINMLKYDYRNLQKAMEAIDYNKWAKRTIEYLKAFGGWKKISNLILIQKLKKTIITQQDSETVNRKK